MRERNHTKLQTILPRLNFWFLLNFYSSTTSGEIPPEMIIKSRQDWVTDKSTYQETTSTKTFEKSESTD